MSSPETELSKQHFVKRRGFIKAKVTLFGKYLSEWTLEHGVNALQLRIDNYQRLLDEFQSIQLNLLDLEDEKVLEKESQQFEKTFFSFLERATELIAQHRKEEQVSFTTLSSPTTQNVQLPKIELVKFTGEISEWESFSSVFKALIHDDDSLNNVKKLCYLKGCLVGSPQQLIAPLPLTAENYDVAWKLLESRYQNVRLISMKLISQLFQLKGLQKQSAVALRQLLDDFSRTVESLRAMKHPVEHWNLLLVHLFASKLDIQSRQAWELKAKGNDLPTYNDLVVFLLRRCNALELIEQRKEPDFDTRNKRSNRNLISEVKSQAYVQSFTTTVGNCELCHQAFHSFFNCTKFREMPLPSKVDYLRKIGACFNCLRKGHSLSKCKSSLCKICHAKHNTILHGANLFKRSSTLSSETQVVQPVKEETASNNLLTQLSCVSIGSRNIQVLMSTAVVEIANHDGKWIRARCLLDMASQSNLISADLVEKLQLPQTSTSVPIRGVNCQMNYAVNSVSARLSSRVSKSFKNESLTFLVLPQISPQIPSVEVMTSHFAIPSNVPLADPDFATPAPVQLLLGAEIFWKVLQPGFINIGPNAPTLRNTLLGWICTGVLPTVGEAAKTSLCKLTMTEPLASSLERFWELENVSPSSTETRRLSADEERCEHIFKESTIRDSSGRFEVHLPFREDSPRLGSSKSIASRRFYSLEARLNKNPPRLNLYRQFMNEYQLSGHMVRIPEDHDSHQSYYIPHFEVIRETSVTTPLRVVFDSSQPTSNNRSLNDELLPGPKSLGDLRAILLRFRSHKYAFTGDIKQFFRQIKVTEDHRKYQKIFWRDNCHEPIQVYQLNTVTYGMTSSPYLANRSIEELFKQEQESFPLCVGENDNFYVDDYLSGDDKLHLAINKRAQISALMAKGCFQICKWSTNDLQLLATIPEAERSQDIVINLTGSSNEPIKALGVDWLPQEDRLSFSSSVEFSAATMRTILSNVAKLWDPLGLIGPKICTAKLLLQSLWREKFTWDQRLPQSILTRWQEFVKDLSYLDQLLIPRCVKNSSSVESQVFHCFADSSTVAYGACVYLTTHYEDQQSSCHLLAAKHKVVPVSVPQCRTLPQLELCAALLAVHLANFVAGALGVPISSVHFWTDSTIVLDWLYNIQAGRPVFVQNRISSILSLSQFSQWRHVRSEQNPADLLTRGASIRSLANNSLWWNGPPWITLTKTSWPVWHPSRVISVEPHSLALFSQTSLFSTSLLRRYSSFPRLLRVICYCRRFIQFICKTSDLLHGPLTIKEYNSAQNWVFKQVQHEVFQSELTTLSKEKQVSKSSRLRNLFPFLDHEGLIRVGGRLQMSELPFNQKHPIVLPSNHHITKILISYHHERNFHANPQLLIGILRQSIWILKIRTAIRGVLSKCVRCFRTNPKAENQLMGNLPPDRVHPTFPFLVTGVDYCGPIFIKAGTRRTKTITKAYISVFVCFTTRAVHLEVVEDMTAHAFLQALYRFVSRRGCPSRMWSDNGTNFKGAVKLMSEYVSLFRDESFRTQVNEFALTHLIDWRWISPHAPHHGGLWEAAVKQFKALFRKLLISTPLTYSQLNSLVIQIEACLNSRPLTPITDDPSDLSVLTPGHFLIGRSLKAVTQPTLIDKRTNLLTQWEKISHTHQRFWRLWSIQYLNSLQLRNKWVFPQRNLHSGDLVLLMEKNLPPLQWKMGRVLQVFPGRDGHVRIVQLKTSQGIYTRPIQKLALLPLEVDPK